MSNFLKNASFKARIFKYSVSIVILSLLLGCREAPKIFKVGLIIDKGGSHWQSKVNSVELAVKQANQKGLRDGSVIIEIIIQDTGEDAEKSMDVARNLVFQEKVSAIIGPNTTRAALPVSLVAENTNTLMITDGSTHNKTTLNKEFVFRVVATDEQMVTAVSKQLTGVEKVAVLFDKSNIYSRVNSQLISRQLTSSKSQVSLYAYTADNKNFESLLEKIKSGSYPSIILPNFASDLKPQIELINQFGIRSNVFVLDAWDYRIQTSLGDEQVVYVTGLTHPLFFSQSTKAKEYRLDYEKAFQGKPDKSSAVSFDAASMLFVAIDKAADLSSGSLQKALQGLSFQGVTGQLEFDSQGNLNRQVGIFRVTKNNMEKINH